MRSTILILLNIFCLSINANNDVFIKKQYGNVNLSSVYSYYTEEINKTLIIAQYSEILCKKLNYNKTINIFCTENKLGNETISAFYGENEGDNNKNIVTIIFSLNHLDIKRCLNVIEYCLTNKIMKKKLLFIYDNNDFKLSNELISTISINRPCEIEELNQYYFTYYFLNNKFYFKKLDSENKILALEDVYYFKVLNEDIFISFSKINELNIINNNNVKTFIIENIENIFKPYKVKILSNNKISFEFYNNSKYRNRLMLYFIDKNIFIQDLDKIVN